jgi:outer membrane protein assembly factor BamB
MKSGDLFVPGQPDSGELVINCLICGHPNIYEEDDRGAEIYCVRCGTPIPIPEASAESTGQVSSSKSVPADDDRLAWRFRPNDTQFKPATLRNSPAVNDVGVVFAAIGDTVFAFESTEDAEEGVRVSWKYRTGGAIPGSPCLCGDGSLRVHSEDGRLHGISSDGRALWAPVPVGAPLIHASPVVDEEGKTWICGCQGGLLCVDASGKTARKPFYDAAAVFDSTGILWNSTFIVGSEDHYLHAVDLSGSRGKETWNLREGKGETGWYVNSSPAAASGPVFVVAGIRNVLFGFSTQGEKLWEAPCRGQTLGSPAVDGDDRVYLGLGRDSEEDKPSGALACFDLRQQGFVWHFSTRAPVESTPVVGDDGTIYFGDDSGCIYAVDNQGESIWTYEHRIAIRTKGALAGPGKLVFGDDNGELIALHCDSKSLAKGWPKYMGSSSQTGQLPQSERKL